MERKAQDDFASSIELRFRIGGRIIISKLEETVAGCAPRRGTNIRAYANNDIHLHGTSASYAVRTMKKKFSPRREAFFEEMEEIEGETRFRISIIIGSRCKCIATGNTRRGGVRPLAENR